MDLGSQGKVLVVHITQNEAKRGRPKEAWDAEEGMLGMESIL